MQLDCFKTLVETVAMGSFSRAAENLFVTQSTVSRRIQLLEEHYGVQLLDRSSPVLAPTEAGRIVLERATRILNLERELTQRILDLKQNPGVSFCCTPAFGIAYLPEIMKRFMLSHSSISGIKFFFELPDKVIEGLRAGSYQAGIIEHFEQYDLEGFESVPLPDDELVFVSAPSLGLKEDAAIDDLLRHDLYVRMEGCCSSRLLAHNMKSIGRSCSEFVRTVVCADLHLIIDTVSEGNGITFTSRSLVEQQVRSGILRMHRIPGFRHIQQRTMLLGRSSAASPLLQDFVQQIRAAFESSAAPS
ncbi:LysR family transcriptional regulator [Trichlorobacter ammonificans]|uniref:HTH lysR-type domain-containing protein n=1 Tax=Trichlorobacter ammonificans TaxID=2916410 RepID=A0ABM9D6X2_9BACT|nr:LysR family transcriptional regulator [Trichlorobacter ammonificans]CAH2030970.1 HTH lysR-type domain-containing protein [Trichlorobacter ammonificans]